MKSPEMPSSQAEEGRTKSLFVGRLERLIRMRKDYREDLNPLGLRLLDRAIYATYRDCIEYGAADQAQAMMAHHPVPDWDQT